MPAFDLRYIHAARYVNTAGVISYTGKTKVGDAMTADLQLKFAEGRLYAESSLAEYIKKCTGGTISLGVKAILAAAQQLLYGAETTSRTVGTSPGTTISGLKFGAKQTPGYVGVAFFAPDKIDGVEKYTCVFVHKALFGPPAMSFKTFGEAVNFATPTTSGEFLTDDSTEKLLLETGTAETEANAQAWVDLVLGS